MASGDTKTEHLLDVLANGSRADIPADNCCNTKTQNYILGAVNRMISLEEEVEELQNNPDVTDIVSTYQDLTNYDKTTLTDGDVIRVLTDSTHDDESAYYRYNAATDSFDYIGTTRAYTDFIGTSGGMAGASGLVPAPQATDVDKYLKSDGTWATVSGGGGGTTNYNELVNKPSIANVELSGNKTLANLGIQGELVSGTNIKTINNQSLLGSGNITIEGGEEDLSVSDPIGDNALEFADEQGHIAMLVDNEGNIKTKAFDSSTATGTPNQLTDMIYELHRRTAANTTYPAFTIKGNVLVLGDSTVAGTNVGTKISALMSLASGYTLTDISQGGDTIQGQTSKYNNLTAGVKSAVNYAVIQIGLNDVYPASSSVADLKTKYQTLVNTIKTNSPNAYIVISCMLPCRARWQALVPTTADHAQEVWAGLNQTIIDNEYGADAVASIHQWALAYDNFVLRPEYDTGDKIHENKAGQQVILLSWLSAMFNNNLINKGGNN